MKTEFKLFCLALTILYFLFLQTMRQECEANVYDYEIIFVSDQVCGPLSQICENLKVIMILVDTQYIICFLYIFDSRQRLLTTRGNYDRTDANDLVNNFQTSPFDQSKIILSPLHKSLGFVKMFKGNQQRDRIELKQRGGTFPQLSQGLRQIQAFINLQTHEILNDHKFSKSSPATRRQLEKDVGSVVQKFLKNRRVKNRKMLK